MQGSPVQFELEDVSPVEKRLKVQVARELVSSKLDEAYRKLSREVKMPGFRPGKAPRALLERMFGKKIDRDVTEELISDSMMELAKLPNLRLVAQPLLEQFPAIKKGEDLHFNTRLELYPQVTATDYEGIEVTRPLVVVTESDVDAALEDKRRQQQELLPIEGRDAVGPHDFLQIALSGKVGAAEYKGTPMSIDLSDPQQSLMPFLAPALLGIPLSAVDHPITFTFPTEGADAEVAGKEFTATVTIKDAHEKRLPVLDDDFAKDTGDAETLAELREKVKASLLSEEKEEIQAELRSKIMEELVRRNPVHIPPSLHNRVIDSMMESHRHRAVLEAIRTGKDPQAITMQEVRGAAAEEALRSLSAEFVLLAIADKEHVEITDAEVEKRLSEIARQRDKSVARLKAEMQKDDPQLSNMRTHLRLEKALELIESRAKITDEAPATP